MRTTRNLILYTRARAAFMNKSMYTHAGFCSYFMQMHKGRELRITCLNRAIALCNKALQKE